MNDEHPELEQNSDDRLFDRLTRPDPHSLENLPQRDEPTWEYYAVHPDGPLERRTGGRRGIIDYLNYAQDKAHSEGELGTEPLEDLDDIEAAWIGTYDRERLPDNPVANHMIQVFDLGQTIGRTRGIVAFTPAFYRAGRGRQLVGHRLALLLKIHAEIRADLDAGRKPRQRLWPSEMITASRGVEPNAAWEEFQRLRSRLAPDEKITDVIREREIHLRAGRDPDHV
ncbi:hypothetical protein [Nocardiopsis sp. JB363]|uniref:hypothetical protein n=1 Tax=Nocardiopsis sp. JB363 TaxID=1434837 RepID=UPI00097B1E20|nr:hypothetical protein [Nocardiopsis sp. JB363]SIO84611.1 hypothetical protein BQ8420_02785 [Nocardiopsis sp. JB363]